MSTSRSIINAAVSGGLMSSILVAAMVPIGALPSVSTLLDPADGLYRTARGGLPAEAGTLVLPGLTDDAFIRYEPRGVPHIFADSDEDAIRAMGYAVARDRLFQMDYIQRVASGRLSEVFGSESIRADRFLRRTGMEWGAKRALDSIESDDGIEKRIISWYLEGVNAYIDSLEPASLPLEYRLIGYEPERWTPLHVLRVLQFMAFDLSFRGGEPRYSLLAARLPAAEYDKLYPADALLSIPIMDPCGPTLGPDETTSIARVNPTSEPSSHNDLGWKPGIGSNNWVVGPQRSTTGAAILAGDMHLELSLPAVWYEVHLATPEMNVYGVTVPGAPLPVEAFSNHLAWAFTNTPADQIDHYRLEMNPDLTAYRYEGEWRDLEISIDTIHVAGEPPKADTIRYAHWGPVIDEEGSIAIQWTAHYPTHTLSALWGMLHARTRSEFDAASRHWDTPVQNIAYADTSGLIAIRSTGHIPIRGGGTGRGLLDGSSGGGEWTGRIPFDELPQTVSPSCGYVTSTNQQPIPSTSYPYYLGHDWRSTFRSIRIKELLEAKAKHSPNNIASYHSDVHVVQYDFMRRYLGELDSSDTLARELLEWNGRAEVAGRAPLAFYFWLEELQSMTWDEDAFVDAVTPHFASLVSLMAEEPESAWFDNVDTPEKETARDIRRMSWVRARTKVESTAAGNASTWGDEHSVVFRHLTRAGSLSALWRGPWPFPGFDETLSPAAGLQTTHSASWRVVVDLSSTPPKGIGVYPGGQSGNPFSRLYDAHLHKYMDFEYFDLQNPPAAAPSGPMSEWTTVTLKPSA